MASNSFVQSAMDSSMDPTLAVAPTPLEPAPDPAQANASLNAGPIPMSFPAILRGSGLVDRFAHLRPSDVSAPAYPKKNRRDEKEGKRWVRRNDNARFVGNVHIVAATKQDYAVPIPSARSTFPAPLPPYLPRTHALPATVPPPPSPLSASAGRFSLSLKGMRRELRRSGPRTEVLVREIEDAVISWLGQDVWINPDAAENVADEKGTPIGTLGLITELARTHAQLQWAVTDDGFARYVVHCCARYHNIVSFSKDTSGTRLTYLLRPTHPLPDQSHLAEGTGAGISGLDTPPPTDESALDPESDFALSDIPSDVPSDVESERGIDAHPSVQAAALSDIEESRPGSPWSILSDPLAEADSEGEATAHLAQGVRSLSLSSSEPPAVPLPPDAPSQPEPEPELGTDTTARPRARLQYRQSPLHSRLWDRQRSSPSRSPARRGPARYIVVPMSETPTAKRTKRSKGRRDADTSRSFYEYLFS